MEDLSVFDKPETLKILNPNIVLLGLNFSVSGAVNRPFENFHGKGGGLYIRKLEHQLFLTVKI